MSRAHRVGTIYSRVEGLIRKGFLNEWNKPLWFDVYKQFPPIDEPSYKREEPEMTVKEIFYQEDALRAKIHKAFQGHLRAFNLQNDSKSYSQTLLKSCMEYISQGISEDEAIKKLEDSFKSVTEKSSTNTQTKSKMTLQEILEG